MSLFSYVTPSIFALFEDWVCLCCVLGSRFLSPAAGSFPAAVTRIGVDGDLASSPAAGSFPSYGFKNSLFIYSGNDPFLEGGKMLIHWTKLVFLQFFFVLEP